MIISYDGNIPSAKILLQRFEEEKGTADDLQVFLRLLAELMPAPHYALFSGRVVLEGEKVARRRIRETTLSLREDRGGLTISISPEEDSVSRSMIRRCIETAVELKTSLLFDPKRSSIIISIPRAVIGRIRPLPNFAHGYICLGAERHGGGWKENFRIEHHLVEGRSRSGNTVLISENGFRDETRMLADTLARTLPHWNVAHTNSACDDAFSVLNHAWKWERNDVIPLF